MRRPKPTAATAKSYLTPPHASWPTRGTKLRLIERSYRDGSPTKQSKHRQWRKKNRYHCARINNTKGQEILPAMAKEDPSVKPYSGITKLWFSDPPLLFCCELLLSRWPRCLIRLSMICSSLRRIGIVMMWFAVRSALQVVAWFAGLWFSHRKSRRWCLVILEINVNGERWSYGFSMVEGLVNRCRLLKTWWR